MREVKVNPLSNMKVSLSLNIGKAPHALPENKHKGHPVCLRRYAVMGTLLS